MDRTPLYQQIAESVRQELLYGKLAAGDFLPPVRDMAARWGCTTGTVQRAYAELARDGLITSRAGLGTRVAAAPQGHASDQRPLRWASLVNQAERFLLEMMAAGHDPGDVARAVELAIERWRSLAPQPAPVAEGVVRFAGSHDPAIDVLARRFADIAPGHTLKVSFSGSLGGLIGLAQGEAEISGCHLWDEECDCYNVPFVRRLLPGRSVVLLTLAERRLGLIISPGNPTAIGGLESLASGKVRLVNRQRGSGTRVWLDAQLCRLGIDPAHIAGYDHEVMTHSAVASAVAAGQADVVLGVETAAQGLGFVPLARERYDLVMLEQVWRWPAIQALAAWLRSSAAARALAELGGYETADTGTVERIDP
jgi:putative molybdopterin biosynthesis protein